MKMTKISAKELIEAVEAKIDSLLIANKYLVKRNYVYTNDQIDTDGLKDFPRLFYWWNDSGSLNENYNTVVLGFVFCDVMTGKQSELKRDYEIKSDMLQAASILFDDLSRDPVFDAFGTSISYTPFSDRFANGLSGIQASVTFSITKPCGVS